MVSALSPKKPVTGLATHAEKEPFMAKTIKIAAICQFEVIPQRALNFSIVSFDAQN